MSTNDQRITHFCRQIANEHVSFRWVREQFHQARNFVRNVDDGQEDGHGHAHQHVVEIEATGRNRSATRVDRRNETFPVRSLTGREVPTGLGDRVQQRLHLRIRRDERRFAFVRARHVLFAVPLTFVTVEQIKEKLV